MMEDVAMRSNTLGDRCQREEIVITKREVCQGECSSANDEEEDDEEKKHEDENKAAQDYLVPSSS